MNVSAASCSAVLGTARRSWPIVVPGIRCAVCWNVESARLGRAHNDANVISIGERMVSEDKARAVVDAWLNTSFEGGRHQHRIEKIDKR